MFRMKISIDLRSSISLKPCSAPKSWLAFSLRSRTLSMDIKLVSNGKGNANRR